jgi:hypothetical protein
MVDVDSAFDYLVLPLVEKKCKSHTKIKVFLIKNQIIY